MHVQTAFLLLRLSATEVYLYCVYTILLLGQYHHEKGLSEWVEFTDGINVLFNIPGSHGHGTNYSLVFRYSLPFLYKRCGV